MTLNTLERLVLDLGAVGGIVAAYVGIRLWLRQKRADAAHPAFQSVEDDELRMIRLIQGHGPLRDYVEFLQSPGPGRAVFTCDHGHVPIDRDAEDRRGFKAMRSLIRKGLAEPTGTAYTLTDDGRAVYRDRKAINLPGPDFAS